MEETFEKIESLRDAGTKTAVERVLDHVGEFIERDVSREQSKAVIWAVMTGHMEHEFLAAVQELRIVKNLMDEGT